MIREGTDKSVSYGATRMATVVSLLLALGLLSPGPSAAVRTSGLIEREVAFTQTVSCESAQGPCRARQIHCVAALPQSTPRQHVAIEWITPGARVSRDALGNLVLRFDRDALESGQSFELGWRARVRLQSVVHEVDRARLTSPLAIPQTIAGRYLRNDEPYGLDDPALKATAEAARRAASDPLDLAFRLNELVRGHVHYERDGKWDPAPVVWKRGSGSCSEYHYVFASLCRNAGLPVRWVGASALRSGADEYVDTVFHRWSEVWLPGYGWYPVDSSRNDSEDGAGVNESFGRTSAPLLEISRGDGGEDNPLGWGYVADVKGVPEGGAELTSRRRFTWTPAPAEAAPEIKLETLLAE
jgi:Transglutaminase-like superfamily